MRTSTMAAGCAFALGMTVAGNALAQCEVPDNGTGTITLPPMGCEYVSPAEEGLVIIDGLPPGTTIEIEPIHREFFCVKFGLPGCPPPGVCEAPGGNLGGDLSCFHSTLVLQMTGTGTLKGFSRTISVPALCQVHTGPRSPGDPIQDFDTEMVHLQGELFGDPDFDNLRITGGAEFGLPSPGHTTLTRLGPPGSNFNVDSFFDVTYQIEFQGAPGSVLEGFGGTTSATVRLQTNGPDLDCGPSATGSACLPVDCPDPNQQCVPTCVNFNPITGAVLVTNCECRGPDECQVDLAGTSAACVIPEGPPGTVTLPPMGCEYTSSEEFHLTEGLPPGTTIDFAPIHRDFICQQGAFPDCPPPGICETPGGDLGGNISCFSSVLTLEVTGTGDLAGFSRMLFVQTQCQVATGPRNPGDTVQDFDTEMVILQANLFGDPDFCTLGIVAGSGMGLPSPGHTTLTQLSTGDFAVDSFFDITYQISFAGCPGSVLEGLSGTTTATIRMETAGLPGCVGDCPPGQQCERTMIENSDGTLTICCDCVDVPCPWDLNGDSLAGFSDLLIVLSSWGPCPDPCAPDFDGDGLVGFSDLLALLAVWGPCPP